MFKNQVLGEPSKGMKPEEAAWFIYKVYLERYEQRVCTHKRTAHPYKAIPITPQERALCRDENRRMSGVMNKIGLKPNSEAARDALDLIRDVGWEGEVCERTVEAALGALHRDMGPSCFGFINELLRPPSVDVVLRKLSMIAQEVRRDDQGRDGAARTGEAEGPRTEG